MKKNLLFAGLLLCAAPMFAQEGSETGPVRTSQDAKVMFEQDFEKDWDEFLNTEIDRITQMRYYVNNGSGTKNNTKIWQDTTGIWELGEVRDTLLILKNGVMTTDAAAEIEGFKADQYTIVNDEGNNVDRQAKLDDYGVNGGTHYFRYVTDTVGIATSDYGAYHTDHTTANYRRNLFVRGLDIEDESSYRLTFYVKAENKSTTVKTTMYADVMRGYFHSEKPFSMGLEDDADNNKFNRTFEYKKDAFTGDWEKVTFMTYYLNDSIADRFVFINGYWWDTDWSWGRPNGDTLRYVQQPDKFFVRLSFASDSTIFSVDNISLTKSWIGGVEYYKEMLRVDFGYETNLKDLAKAAYKENKIAAVELPGKFFEVWGLDSNDKLWYPVDIASAEYHDDGYMYMWTQPIEEGGQIYPNEFEDYDSVLVSFINPVDSAKLCLKYTGNMFPKALDTEWVKAGKMVPDFHNEIATKNPVIINGVYSMKNLPPVCQGYEYEPNSFNLGVEKEIREMYFKFSRSLAFDALGEATTNAVMHVSQAGVTEVWTVKSSDESGKTVFVRPSKYTTPLSGDYEFKLLQLRGPNTDYGEDVTVNYSFGVATYDPSAPGFSVDFSGWDTENGYKQNLDANGFSVSKCATKVTEFGGKYSKALMFGLYGQNTGAENNANNCCKLFYTFDWAADAAFDLEIGATGCQKGSWNDGCLTRYFLYDADGNEIDLNPDDAEIAYFEKGGFNIRPDEGGNVDEVEVVNIHVDELKAGTYKLAITLPNEGSWGGGHKGGLILYYMQAGEKGSIATPYMAAFANAQKNLAAKIAASEENMNNYGGVAYEEGVKTLDAYKDFNQDKTHPVTKPSEWNAATSALNAATSAMNSRSGIVDNMWSAYNKSLELSGSYDEKAEAEGLAYGNLSAYKALVANCEKFEDFVAKDQTDDSIKAIQAIFEADQKALDASADLLKKYSEASAKAAEVLAGADASYDEYAVLEAAVNKYASFDASSATDDEIKAATEELASAANGYTDIVALLPLATARMKTLAETAKALGATLGDNAAEIEAYMETAKGEDEKIVSAYKKAIKIAIYEKFQNASAGVDTIDLSGFIANAGMYVDVEINDTYKFITVMDWGKGGNRDYAMANRNTANSTLFPGWNLNMGGGQLYPGGYVQKEAADYAAMPRYADSWIAFDWSTSFSIDQEVTDLPEGQYLFGSWFQWGNIADKTFMTAKVGDKEFSADMIGNGGGEGATSGPADHWIDSIYVADGQNLTIGAKSAGQNSWGYIDNFTLKLAAQPNTDYAALLEAEKKALEEILTFVDQPMSAGEVSYFGLDGVAIQAPKAGQIAVKVTKNANGQRTIEKIRVK